MFKKEIETLRTDKLALISLIGTIIFITFLLFSSGIATVNAYDYVTDNNTTDWFFDLVNKPFLFIDILFGAIGGAIGRLLIISLAVWKGIEILVKGILSYFKKNE